MSALEAQGLNTFYGKSPHPARCRSRRRRGPHHRLAGPQRRGKSTTLRSLVGLTPPRSGHVRIFGAETTRLPAFSCRRARRRLCARGRRIFPNLTVHENLRVPLERPGRGRFRESTRCSRG
ncbi:MAG: ATP-binding cassette domain-containing protein [Acetobacteraceae bacterium]